MAYSQGSIVHLGTSGVMLLDFKNPLKLARELKPRRHMMEEMGAAYMAEGIVTLAGSRMYTSLADTDEVIDEALDRFERVLSSVDADGSRGILRGLAGASYSLVLWSTIGITSRSNSRSRAWLLDNWQLYKPRVRLPPSRPHPVS